MAQNLTSLLLLDKCNSTDSPGLTTFHDFLGGGSWGGGLIPGPHQCWASGFLLSSTLSPASHFVKAFDSIPVRCTLL